MKFLLTSSALVAVLAFAPAHAQQSPPAASLEKEGSLTVQGIEPSKVLGAIDTAKLTDKAQAEAKADAKVAVTSEVAQPPTAKSEITVDTDTKQTADAKIETRTEVIKPVSGRPALDPDHPIAPEVQAVVNSKKRYTTADIVMAQLEAVKNTPVTQPSTIVTTTTVTPDPG